jgi:hypothetical protein
MGGAVDLYGKNKKEWLKTFLELPKGIPSHDMFGRVFSAVEEYGNRKQQLKPTALKDLTSPDCS